MRTLLLIPASISLTAVGGFLLCVAAGKNPHAMELAWAAGAILTACVAGVIPIILTRGGCQLAVSQAALTGSMLHLFVALLPAVVAMVSGGVHAAFLYWMLPFYWMTLIAMVAIFIRAIKSAPVHTTPTTTTTTGTKV